MPSGLSPTPTVTGFLSGTAGSGRCRSRKRWRVLARLRGPFEEKSRPSPPESDCRRCGSGRNHAAAKPDRPAEAVFVRRCFRVRNGREKPLSPSLFSGSGTMIQWVTPRSGSTIRTTRPGASCTIRSTCRKARGVAGSAFPKSCLWRSQFAVLERDNKGGEDAAIKQITVVSLKGVTPVAHRPKRFRSSTSALRWISCLQWRRARAGSWTSRKVSQSLLTAA